MSPLTRLPNEILTMIGGYLGTRDIASLRSTNKHLAGALRVSLYDSTCTCGRPEHVRRALYYAAAKKDHWILSRLFRRGAERLIGNGRLLNDAIERGCSDETIRTFIDCGANINRPSNFGMTPLATAADRGRLKLVELLLSRGAEVKTKYILYCPFLQAASSGHTDILRAILHAYPGPTELNFIDHYGRTLLHSLTTLNYPEAIWILVQNAMVDVNVRDHGGVTPLGAAVEANFNHIARILLSSGRTDVNLADKDDDTPLHKAARRDNVGLVKMLVESDGVNRAPINRAGMSPLMIAQSHGKQAVVDLLEG
ncbi:ankyrin repeat-containing domain protein [Tuber brumale]|nr:ankyrin repeat-containing domain protein [Tuber brumale]